MATGLLSFGHPVSFFNNGKSQINFNTVQSGSGEYPFMNLMKTANIGSILLPNNCDSNGYPTIGGGSWFVSQPSQNERAGSYYLRWTGTGVASFGVGMTVNSGSLTPSGGVGFVEVTPTSSTVGPAANSIQIIFSGPAQNITYCHNADDSAVQANQNEFHPQFMAVMRALNCGVLRFINWFSGSQNRTTTWASRSPTTYSTFSSSPLESANYGGVGSWTGTDISLSTPPGGFTIQDKARLQYFAQTSPPSIVNSGISGTVTNGSTNITLPSHGLSVGNQVYFGSNTVISCTFSGSTVTATNTLVADQAVYFQHVGSSVLPSNITEFTPYYVLAAGLSGSSFQISTTAGGTPITFTGSPTGTSNSFRAVPTPFVGVIGNVLSQVGGGTNPAVTTYFVKTVVDANTVVLSATAGGAAITCTSGGTCIAFGFVTISVGGGAKIPVFNTNFYPYPQGFVGYPSVNTASSCRVLVYDATFGALCDFGSTAGGVSVPPEVCLDLCYKLGAHPWFCAPTLACDPITDFIPQLGAYIQSTYQNGKAPWMVPRLETPNEMFNSALAAGDSQYGYRKAGYYGWPGGVFDWEGKIGSTVGQACANVWGYGNLGIKYHWYIGVNVNQGTNQSFGTGFYTPTFNSNQFMTNDPSPLQSPYTRTPAFVWCSHLCTANYIVPSANTENAVVSLGFQYTVTNAGNPTAQLQNVADYVDTLGGAALHTNIAQVVGYFTNWVAFGQGVTFNGVTPQTHWTYLGTNYTFGVACYEGGYSPDYGGSGGAVSTITGATVTSGTTVDLTCNGTSIQGNGSRTGNAAVVGMYFKIANVAGMTQLNANVYQVSNVSGSTVTITVPSTAGFGTYTSGGSATYYQDAGATISADTWIQTMRGQGKLCTSSTAFPSTGLGGWITSSYNQLTAIGVIFPSCFMLGDVPPPPSGDVWSILNDIYQPFSTSPQALAIQAYNH